MREDSGESNSDVMNNDHLLRWCYANRLIRQISYFNYFRNTNIEKSEHKVDITMNFVSLLLDLFIFYSCLFDTLILVSNIYLFFCLY